jgi:ABC-type branched-subunit amino acid transport system ATPase component
MSSVRATADGDPILELDGVSRFFGGVRAVDGVSFSVPRQQITGLIGPNGAGKSTLLNLIAGVEAPSAGAIRYEGRNIAGQPSHLVAQSGVVRTFQQPSEFGRMTVLENLIVAAPGRRGASVWGALRSKRYWRDDQRQALERARELLEQFGLAFLADEYAGELSTGQRRLVEIVRGLMAEPKILLLDEPCSGLSPSAKQATEAHLMRLRGEGVSMLMVEHELDAVERLTDSVVVMAEGRVLAAGVMRDLRTNREVGDAYLTG